MFEPPHSWFNHIHYISKKYKLLSILLSNFQLSHKMNLSSTALANDVHWYQLGKRSPWQVSVSCPLTLFEVWWFQHHIRYRTQIAIETVVLHIIVPSVCQYIPVQLLHMCWYGGKGRRLSSICIWLEELVLSTYLPHRICSATVRHKTQIHFNDI